MRARVEWAGKPPLADVPIDLHESGFGSDERRDWKGSFEFSAADLRSVDPNADDIRITLADGRSGKALVSLRIDSEGGFAQFKGAGPLE